ncbi:hypothetical protein [Desertivibrio insolitus]|uniref:hypothetical protein n=1 Tax=Herbiconiux sp. SYSU D00978 TaxID=2812562 RepID=UPI001A966830|nr:hypothetical protein [Herbiconiux sp. SYSU D00978]
MTSTDTPPTCYAIRVAGHLDAGWAVWFDGMHITTESGGTTLLRGDLADQAALHGILNRLRDSGLPLLSVNIDHSRSTS